MRALPAMLGVALAGCSTVRPAADRGATDVSAVPTEETAASCSDGRDNDADGLTDCADPGCWPLRICEAARADAGDGSPQDRRQCAVHCDCDQGSFCYKGLCVKDPKTAVYCCSKPGCPPGATCVDIADNRSACREDESYHCATACDCGPAHCCKYGVCVKDTTDPWRPGGTAIKDLACTKGIDPTYCCASADCHAARIAYGTRDVYFRCFDLTTGRSNTLCGGRSCQGTACNCAPGEVCLDTTTTPDPPAGHACHQETGGTCVSWAAAEAFFGWAASDLLGCCEPGCTVGARCDAGWRRRHDVGYAYQRVVGRCGPCADGKHHSCGGCGDGTCDEGESPTLCPADCRCGDGACAPEEVGACPADCGRCGNRKCELGEPETCVADCKLCGDGWCAANEVDSCSQDCWGACYGEQLTGHYVACGDGYCGAEWSRCAADCGSLPSTWVPIAPGAFTMGSAQTEPCRSFNEDQHRVTLTRGFEIQDAEVTQAEFENLIGYNPSDPPGCGTCPVGSVSWYEAVSYCNALSKAASLPACYECTGSGESLECEEAAAYRDQQIYDCPGYRLPTEAEWEYAYRAGSSTPYHSGVNDPGACDLCTVLDANLDGIGWYCANANDTAHPGRSKQPNAWGLYDMAGNAEEWCHDRYLANLGSEPTEDPFGSTSPYHTSRVVRSGSYGTSASGARAAARHSESAHWSERPDRGFRCARTLKP